MKSSTRRIIVALLIAGATVGGAYSQSKYDQRKAAADQRLVASVLIFQCNEIKGLILVPQHDKPAYKDGSDGYPLAFYRESVILSINGVMRLNVPCANHETLARR